jgi:predicted phage tail protein
MLREIKIYGRLAKFLGRRVFRAEVASAAEAVRFLVTNFPELEKHMADQHYRVSVGGHDLSLDELHNPAGQQQIKIVPVLAGAGSMTRILIGAALIVGSFFTGGATIGLFGLAAPLAVSTVMLGLGASLVLGGVAQMLSPVPDIPKGAGSDNDPRKSYSFSSIQNTSRQGTPVPVVYGETIVGSVVISAGIDIAQVAA